MDSKVRRISDRSEIISLLQQIPSMDKFHSILVRSRAARHYLPNFRQLSEELNAGWDIISFVGYLKGWLSER